MLALHQPVASDLRRIAVVLKINGDLHRLCDLARHIAKRVKKLASDPRAVPVPQPLENLGLEALSQVHDSLDALTQSDVILAQSRHRRRPADRSRLPSSSRSSSNRRSPGNPERINTLLRLVNTATRPRANQADHAANIAESVVYLKPRCDPPAPDGQPVGEPEPESGFARAGAPRPTRSPERSPLLRELFDEATQKGKHGATEAALSVCPRSPRMGARPETHETVSLNVRVSRTR